MALFSFFRSVLNRLSFLKRPIPLVSTIVVVMLGIFISEYIRHPEWFGTYSQEGSGPEDIDLSGLTPEEQAAVADIDNLRLLLNDLGVESGGIPDIQALPEDEDGLQPQNSLLQDLLAIPEPTEGSSLSESSNPFDQYLNQYQFIGRSSQSAPQTDSGPSNGTVSNSSGLSFFSNVPQGSNSETSRPTRTSALEQALQAQREAAATNSETAERMAEDNGQSSAGDTPSSQVSGNRGTSQATTGEGSQSVTVPGVPFPVLSNSIQTSPPPGTTGYTPPAALQLTQPTPGSNSAAGFPSGNPSTLNPSGAGIPNIPSAANTPGIRTPQVDVSNGFVSPSVPSTPATPSVESTLTPSPFAVPRPPGSYTGGGYINTFSNPSAPPE